MDWVAGLRPWPQLLRLLDRLPADSHYKAELADDDEYAMRVLEANGGKSPDEQEQRRTMHGYSPMVDALYVVADRVGQLLALTQAVNSKDGKAPEIDPMPRPETALKRVQERFTVQRHHDRVRTMLGREPES